MNEINDGSHEVFSSSNRPSSIEAAQARSELIQHDIERILSSLDSATDQEFNSNEQYRVWRIRASDAIGWKRAELRFIESWIKSHEKSQHQKVFEKDKDKLIKLARRLNLAIDFTPLYSAANLPTSLQDINRRFTELVEAKGQVEVAMQEIKAASYEIGRGPTGAFFRAKSMITKTLKSIEVEIAFLNGCRRSVHGPQQDLSSKGPSQEQISSPFTQQELGVSIRLAKQRIGMNGPEMIAWLYRIVRVNLQQIRLTDDQSSKLAAIGDYVRLSEEMAKINSGIETFSEETSR